MRLLRKAWEGIRTAASIGYAVIDATLGRPGPWDIDLDWSEDYPDE